MFTGPPTVIIYPTNAVINATGSVILDCRGTGKGTITYAWEFSSIDGGRWSRVTDINKIVVRTLDQSEKYRCIVSNEAGRTVSNISIVTLMGKSMSLYQYRCNVCICF